MKKKIVILFTLLLTMYVFGEKVLRIYKSDYKIESFKTNTVDSIKFENDKTNLQVYRKNQVLTSVPITQIDSIKFADSTIVMNPSVITTTISSITYSSVKIGININSIGSSSVVEKGVVWGNTRNPVASGNRIVVESNESNQCIEITDLNANSQYYARAYIKNEAGGVYYGNQMLFSTKNNLPVVVTSSAVYLSATKYINCIGKVINTGSSDLIERGICWGTNANPTVSDNKLVDGSATTGSFIGKINNFDTEKDYYVRAYATNNAGTTYGKTVRIVPLMGNVTFSMGYNATPEAMGTESYNLLKQAMDSASYYLSKYTGYVANISVEYSPGTPTADCGFWGHIRMGSNQRYMYVGTIMHETCHFFGSGTYSTWFDSPLTYTNAKLNTLTNGTYTYLNKGGVHFWPFGMNQREEVANEVYPYNEGNYFIIMAKLLWEMRLDCGWRTY